VHTETTETTSRLAHVLAARPDRIAAAWRRVCFGHRREQPGLNLLDGVVESFVRELGFRLQGVEGSPWARSQGVLRLSRTRGVKGLQYEFAALRQCLLDALTVLGGSQRERDQIQQAILEGLSSCAAALAVLEGENPPARTPFGGVVVELFERPESPQSVRHETPASL
jgi:hypothetical protein